MTQKSLILIGAGGHCLSCIDVIRLEAKLRITGILDVKEKVGHVLEGIPIIGTDREMSLLANDENCFLITIGQIKSSELRFGIFEKLMECKANLATIISPLAYVSASVIIGPGTIVHHKSFINSGSIIGRNVIVNSGALIEHECIIGDHSHISTSAVVNGNVTIGFGTFIGSNATIRQGVKIGNKVVIGAGSVIVGDVADETIVYGNPGKIKA